MSTATQPADSADTEEPTVSADAEPDAETIKSVASLSTQPAQAVADHFDTWADVEEFIDGDGDWEDIDGVGEQTSYALNMAREEIVDVIEDGESEPTPEPDVEDEAAEEDTDEDDGDSDDSAAEEPDTADDEATEEEPATETAEESDEEPDEDVEEDEDTRSRIERQLPPETFAASVEVSEFADVMGSVNRLVDEAKLQIHEDGILIKAVDPANVGMVRSKTKKEGFTAYEGSPGVIGVNLIRLTDILSMGDKGEMLSLTFDVDTRKLHIEINGLEYTLATIDPQSIREEPELPDLELPTTFEIDPDEFDRAVTATDMVSDHVAIESDGVEEVVRIQAEGDTDDVELELDEDDVEDLQQPAERFDSMFSLEYMRSINKIVSQSDRCVVYLGDEFPVRLDMDFGVEDGDDGETETEPTTDMDVLLAPRIQSN